MATSLELAITAIRSNRKEEGRQLLNLLIQENPNNEMAWLWMSSVVNTDEQRARCLYHVLAINPDNQIARRGLQLLGIVVSDSRPVKVPRDSRPIQIPKPSPPQAKFPPESLPEPEPAPAEERRPFRIDPQAIVDELPFTPITKPFTETLQPAGSSATASPSPPAEQTEQAPRPSEPVPVVQTNDVSESATVAQPQPATQPSEQKEQTARPSEPVPVVQPETVAPGSGSAGSFLPHPSEPAPVVQTNAPEAGGLAAQQQPPATGPWQPGLAQQVRPDTGPLPNRGGQQPTVAGTQPMNPAAQTYYPGQVPSAPQQFAPGTAPLQDTRPSQPVPVVPMPPPSQPAPAVHSNVTMGMPTQDVSPQGYSQPVSPVHSHTTMGMPAPTQLPGPVTGQMPHPSEPVQAIHSNTTMGMPAYYGQPQPQQPMPPNQALHSSSTMMMPVGTDPLATPPPPGHPGMADYRVVNASNLPNDSKSNQLQEKDDEAGEEINVLAVIIFGSLSVTALGGLGMLILLTFATP